MELDRRNRISGLYHAALARTPETRGAFLRDACNGDEGLREEVESLLGYESASAQFLETPAAARQAGMLNRQLGPYTFVAPLGVGGMGEVYRARDSKLERDVAIKILPSRFTSDPERRARFAREARLLATLNHPHIGAIYGLEESDGVSGLVLELVEGPTLADRLERGPLPIADALTIAQQVAEALEAAHEKGIVHRDLKPANIVLQGSPNGAGGVRAKVLDFGLAKTLGENGVVDQSLTAQGTAQGHLLGTPAYMSPEQARAHEVDKRTDIWAFGCVLFEMLTGRRAFEGNTITDTLARILDHEPDWSALPRETPSYLRTVLERCLRKDQRRRLHDIADVVIEMEDGPKQVAAIDSVVQRQAARVRRYRVLVGLSAIAVVVGTLSTAGILSRRSTRSADASVGSLELSLVLPTGFRVRGNFALSPDGRRIVFAGGTGGSLALWIRSIEEGKDFRQLPGTEGAMDLAWSPDSRQVVFVADRKLKKVAVSGGAPSEICAAPQAEGSGVSWSQDGILLFKSTDNRLDKVSLAGGSPTPVTTLQPADFTHRYPRFLPDGQHFLFMALGQQSAQLRIGSLASPDSSPLGSIHSNAIYASGHLLFMDDTLMAQPFDLSSLQLTGEPVSLNLRATVSPPTPTSPSPARMIADVSQSGLLAIREFRTLQNRLTWFDRKGSPVGSTGDPGAYSNLRLSPDDRRLAVANRGDIWIFDVDQEGGGVRITDNPAGDFDPTWSLDGTYVLFNSNRLNDWNVFRRPSDGSGRDEMVAVGNATSGVSPPDGKFVIRSNPPGAVTDNASTPLPIHAVAAGSGETHHDFSPDGRWVAYTSNRTGRQEIYVQAFPFDGHETRISRDGGWFPRWRDEGELFFLALDGFMMSTHLTVGDRVVPGVPQKLFPTTLVVGRNQHPYDVTRNGQRFVLAVFDQSPAEVPFTVVTNWTARLPR